MDELLRILLTLGVLWLVLKVVTAIIAIPFQILGFILSLPVGTILWLVIIFFLVRRFLL